MNVIHSMGGPDVKEMLILLAGWLAGLLAGWPEVGWGDANALLQLVRTRFCPHGHWLAGWLWNESSGTFHTLDRRGVRSTCQESCARNRLLEVFVVRSTWHAS